MSDSATIVPFIAILLGGAAFAYFASWGSAQLSQLAQRFNLISKNISHWVLRESPPHGHANVFTRAQVTELFPYGTWQRQAYDDFVTILLDDDTIFPCVYATKGFKADNQLYIFIDTDDLSDWRHIQALADALMYYLPRSRSLGPNTSLVLLAKENEHPCSVEEYNTLFWELLNGLAMLDTVAWPEFIPREIDTDLWCFCFGGSPFFTVVQTPAHKERLSRYAKGLTIVFQPKWIFEILLSTPEKRAGALAKVRGYLKKYDRVSVSPELKNYGEPGSREAKQYFLLDENVPASCPFSQLAAPKLAKA